MIVNNVDIKQKYGSKVIWGQQRIKSREVITYNDWLDNAFEPVKLKPNKHREFEIYIDCVVEGSSKEECELIFSQLVADFDGGECQLDDMKFIYKFDFKSDVRTFVRKWAYHYEITLKAYSKKGPRQTQIFFNTQEIKFDVKGTAETPLVMKLKSDISLVSLEITELTEEPIIISKVGSGTSIVIDSERGIFTEDDINIVDKVEFWEFPKLKPGEITITLSQPCSGRIEYNPRYL